MYEVRTTMYEVTEEPMPCGRKRKKRKMNKHKRKKKLRKNRHKKKAWS